jgi:hypothetical protein
VQDFNLDAVNRDAKSLHRLKFLFGYRFEITCELGVASMDNYFHL